MPKRAVEGDGKKSPLNMRTTPQLREKLEKAAAESGRSLVQEVEYRIERSFERQSMMREVLELVYGNAEWAAMLTKAQDVGKLRMKPSVKDAILRKSNDMIAEILAQIPDAPERPRPTPQSPEQMLEIAKELTLSLGGKVVKK